MYYNRFYTVDPFKPRSVEFGVWSTEDVKRLSVTAIHTQVSFDGLGYPIVGGLYDPRLGPLRFNSDPCATCHQILMKCSGHYGHIELPFPVFNPMFTAIVANILKISCFNCHRIMIPEAEKDVLIAQLELIDFGHLVAARNLDQFLVEEYSSHNAVQLRKKIEDIVSNALSQPPNNQCKNADDLWRYYVSKAFRRGGSARGCFNCRHAVDKVTFYKGKLFIEKTDEKKMKTKTFLMPTEAKEQMRKIWEKDSRTLKALIKVLSSSNEQYPTDICFLSAVLVTPTNTRPVQIINQKPVEHSKNGIYKTILLDSLQISTILQVMNKDKKQLSREIEEVVNSCRGANINEKLQNAWHSLQSSVNALLDSSAARSSANSNAGVDKIGLKQLIEKKQGILRKNMMGKRVDFFARSVITPDPLLSVDEIGIPDTFAKKLTFPVPVTPWNVKELQQMVLNGPHTYPGANIVECDDGALTWISGTNTENRKSLAKSLFARNLDSKGPKVVHRHLLDGDMLLINRQPSLHKPSIMAHKARILKGQKTFRLHYANCKAYNADFDGDEMNAHFPQGELARAEAAEIVNVANQYLVPRDGSPLSGLIQDHVVAGIRLSIRGKFFNRLEYNHLVFQALSFLKDDIVLLPPTILKPAVLWSGKQIISTIIINITPKGCALLNLNSSAKIGFNAWPMSSKMCPHSSLQTRKDMSESNVIIRNGELLCGILDKNHVGATHYGLIHSFYELYGGQCSTNLLGAFSKLFTHYQQKDGFTLGVRDILVREKADRKRVRIAIETKSAGIEAAKNALDISPEESIDEQNLSRLLEGAYRKNSNFRALIDRQYKSVLDKYNNEINKTCLPKGLLQLFPSNNLQLMVQSGAKGSTVNTMQISCLLGQIELEGKRPPLMISGRSLPSFRPYDCSPIAGGFIVSRFMTGIQPQEFFFHCMAGREGLIDTAVKTSRSGYLQRCLVKHLESLIVNYDLTVRDSDNSVIQFQYGEDGLDISKSQLLNKDRLQFIADNLKAFYNKSDIKLFKKNANKKEINKLKACIATTMETKPFHMKEKRDSPFLRYCQSVKGEPPSTRSKLPQVGRTERALKLSYKWHAYNSGEQEESANFLRMKNIHMNDIEAEKLLDPVISYFKPDTNLGSVSENLERMISQFLNEKSDELPFKKSKFKDAIYLKSFSSLCQPGEAVGVLAAQSVGEPSTQMTLNTFHFAGRGEMNVTLGIPRLREILMVASKKIKTPSMSIPFLQNVPDLEKKAEKLRRNLTRVVLKDVLEKVIVKEAIHLKEKNRAYTLHFQYLPRKSYSSNTTVTPKRILKYVGSKLLILLMNVLKKYLSKTYTGDLIVRNESIEKNSNNDRTDEDLLEQQVDDPAVNSGDSDDDSDVEGDGDATEAKLKNRRFDAQEYDDEDEDDDDDNDDDDGDENNENEGINRVNESKKLANVGKKNETADSDFDSDFAEEENTISVDDIKDVVNTNVKRSQTLKQAMPTKGYGVLSVEHDDVKKLWSKVVVWTSLSFKKLDFSSIITKVVEHAVIHEVPGIKRAFVVDNEGILTLHTEGSYGIGELFKHDRLLNFNKLYSNDVHSVAQTYGIEAATQVIVREVQNVFKVYGITIDPRHLLLVADYMTFDGSYRPLNRTGMDGCPSPLQQMTFESTLKYLKNATIRQLKDNLQSPSSALVVGQESKIGSGLLKLYCK